MAGLGDIEAFFALKDRFKKWHRPEPLVTNTAQRFIYLYKAKNNDGEKPTFSLNTSERRRLGIVSFMFYLKIT